MIWPGTVGSLQIGREDRLDSNAESVGWRHRHLGLSEVQGRVQGSSPQRTKVKILPDLSGN